jgi:transcriptional regulator with XRE-family HTH domain
MTETKQLQQTWGARLRKARQDAGLSLSQLARAAEVEQGNLSRIENGHVNTGEEARARLAAALGLRVDAIWSYPQAVAR